MVHILVCNSLLVHPVGPSSINLSSRLIVVINERDGFFRWEFCKMEPPALGWTLCMIILVWWIRPASDAGIPVCYCQCNKIDYSYYNYYYRFYFRDFNFLYNYVVNDKRIFNISRISQIPTLQVLSVSYISNLYGGCISDRQLTVKSDILDRL